MTLDNNLLAIGLAGVSAIVLLIAVLLMVVWRRYRKLKDEYEDLAEFVHTLNNELRDLNHATLNVNERFIATDLRLNAFDSQIGRLAERLNEAATLPVQESVNHPYSLAIQKVRKGASISELMQTAGLSQDEAALLIRLHGSNPR